MGANAGRLFREGPRAVGSPGLTCANCPRFRWYSLSILGPRSISPTSCRRAICGVARIQNASRGGGPGTSFDPGIGHLHAEHGAATHSQTNESSEQESIELTRQLRRIIHFLMTGEEAPHDTPFWLYAIASATEGSGTAFPADRDGDRAIALELGYVTYHDAGRSIRRYSPMVTRLAMCCARDWSDFLSVGARQ